MAVKLGYDRIIECRAWLDRSSIGPITRNAVENCLAETTVTVRLAAGTAIVALSVLVLALANLAGIRDD